MAFLARNAGHKRINADAPLNLGQPSAAAMRAVPEIQGAAGVYAFVERHGCIEIQGAAAVYAFMERCERIAMLRAQGGRGVCCSTGNPPLLDF